MKRVTKPIRRTQIVNHVELDAATVATARAATARAGAQPKSSPTFPLIPAAASGWNWLVACEARNALQVILSAGEILLDDRFGALTGEQRTVLGKILDSGRHLQTLIATVGKTEGGYTSAPLISALRSED